MLTVENRDPWFTVLGGMVTSSLRCIVQLWMDYLRILIHAANGERPIPSRHTYSIYPLELGTYRMVRYRREFLPSHVAP